MKDLELVKINSNYCNYLRRFDNKVPYNYGKKEVRPFVGVLFKIYDMEYFAPLSSPKKKHLTMRNTIDFFKLDDGKLGAINFNNMIPVLKDNYTLIDINKKISSKDELKYQKLLKEQLFWLNRNNEKLYLKSQKLYEKYNSGKLSISVKNRCCNYKLLEEKCLEYNKEYVKNEGKVYVNS